MASITSSSSSSDLTEFMASISSSSSSFFSYSCNSQYCPRWKYDVFLSFRGEDTRKTITGYLYERLTRRGIITFQDDKRLEHGDSIPQELLKAMEDSQVALVVFSENYATSRWCLDELVKIMECKKDGNGKTVMPVFYGVDATDVRNQSKSFAEAFAKHELKCKDGEGMQKVQRWRTALTAAANLKGYVFPNGVESDCIERIVDDISSKCKTSVSYLHKVVGINTQLEKVESLLEVEIDDVRIVWIWGMGGVGKTTIANAIYKKLSSNNKFEVSCFLADVKENKRGIHSLQNILLSELLGEKENCVNNKEEGRNLMARRLRVKKVLVVLDDLDHRDQLDYLAGDLGWFGKGSRIIATTRDKRLIGKNVVHEVETLLHRDAIKLFNQYAFMEKVPDECFKDLTLEIVSHAKGHPLALKVWGSLLHGKGIIVWRSALDRIRKNSGSEIIENLKISYDGLEPEEQEIFLDIACFFRGNEKEEVMQILESCDFPAEYGLSVLIDKSLVFISNHNKIQMHDLIQDMGRYIVKTQKHPGKRSRLWNVEDVKEVMINNMGTMAVEAIWFTYFEQLCFNKEAMNNMKRLRILCMCGDEYDRLIDLKVVPYDSNCHDGSIEYLPNNLCWFVWNHYPWESLPENFEPKRLVHLDLQWSSLRYLWNETKHLPSLRRLNLGCSKRLKKTPDFSGMPNLEYLYLQECTILEEVHHSMKCCRKLIRLNLFACKSLEKFPYVNVESLEYLNIEYCSSLEKFPEILGRMKPELEIKVRPSGIREIPSFIFQHQAHLTELHLSDMENLVALPSSICKLKGLAKLDVSWCSKLESLPEEIGDLQNLEELDAAWTLISRPPSSIVRLNKLKFLSFRKRKPEDGLFFVFPQVNEGLRSLEILNLGCCNLIDGGLPEDIGCLSSLKKLDLWGNNFEHLPRSIAQLGALQYLGLLICERLKELPGFMGMPNLEVLDASYTLISRPPSSIVRLNKLKFLTFANNKSEDGVCFVFPQLNEGLRSLEELDLSYCNLIDGGLPEDIGCLSSLKVLNLKGNNFEHLPQSIAQLGALQSLDLSFCKRLKQLPEFPQKLDEIYADWSNDWICNSLFQNISSLQHDISASDSLSLRVFTSRWHTIPSWFHHRVTGRRVSVNLLENWYVPDNFLGFAVGYYGKLIDITAQLIPLCDDGMSNHSECDTKLSDHSESAIHFFLVPLAGLWDTSKANGKRPNDYGSIMLSFSGEKEYGLRLLYKK